MKRRTALLSDALPNDWVKAVREVCRTHPELIRSARTGVANEAMAARFRLYHLAWGHREWRLAEGRVERLPIVDLKNAVWDMIVERIDQSAVDLLAEIVR